MTGEDAEERDEMRSRIARAFVEALPQARELGMRLEEVGEGSAAVAMEYDPRLVGDPETGVIHGGAVFTLMDTCCGVAVITLPGTPVGTATLDLRIDYMRPATPGQRIRARAQCYHVTRSVAFVRAVATDIDEARPVAMATGAFTLDQARETRS
jgi:uncharacterized protein (TIGR00369 family)